MNEAVMRGLLSEARADWGAWRLGTPIRAKCHMCLFDAFKRCHHEHPEWFRKDTRANGHKRKQVKEYILANTKDVPCLEYQGIVCEDDKEDTWERRAVCEFHLRQTADWVFEIMTGGVVKLE